MLGVESYSLSLLRDTSVSHYLELLPLKLRVQNCPQKIGHPQQMQNLKYGRILTRKKKKKLLATFSLRDSCQEWFPKSRIYFISPLFKISKSYNFQSIWQTGSSTCEASEVLTKTTCVIGSYYLECEHIGLKKTSIWWQC